jgi:hypothetical protein
MISSAVIASEAKQSRGHARSYWIAASGFGYTSPSSQ